MLIKDFYTQTKQMKKINLPLIYFLKKRKNYFKTL